MVASGQIGLHLGEMQEKGRFVQVERGERGCGQKLGPASVREGVRMYDRDTIELALLALEEGMTQVEAAE
ncbi:hypothetical protein, partial [Adlercreutzia caecimuris]|uniref:hypothetical protein n=1 Tax=Adlercreutzia caecimuris TaxID=671266 RepID=UPI001C3EDE19